MEDTRHVFTLKQVVNSIRKTIEERYQTTYWVKAEMHKLNLYPSGHAFPELVYKENDRIEAQINGTIWKQHLQRINQQFISVVKEPLQEGHMLLLQVKISFHPTFGLSLQILDIDPSYSLGELQKEREETLKKLSKEGILNKNQSTPFPLLPQRIAIISADTSKGLSDFMKVLNQNPYQFTFFTYLFPAYLQGDVAVDSIVGQLERIKKVIEHFDVVVIVRGGGGEVGMSCYNNYKLCKAIAEFPLPILTGIGHSTNLTVAEMIAFRNAITPTELADFLIQSFEEINDYIEISRNVLRSTSQYLLQQTKNELTSSIKHAKNAAQLSLQQYLHRLQTHRLRYQNLAQSIIGKNSETLNIHQRNLISTGMQLIKEKQQIIHRDKIDLQKNAKRLFEQSKKDIMEREKIVGLMDPKNVLKRGYSITLFKGKSIGKTNPVHEEDKVHIHTYDYTIESTIIKISENNE